MTRTIRTLLARVARNGCGVVIELDEVQRRLGDGWATVSSAVQQSVESLLRNKLDPSDIFLPIDESTWLVVMPQTTQSDALACCLRVAFDVHTSVLESCRLEDLRVSFAIPVADNQLELRAPAGDQLLGAAECAGFPTEVFQCRTLAEPELPPAPARIPEFTGSDEGMPRFVPVWDAKAQAVGAYHCLCAAADSDAVPSIKALQDRALSALQHVVSVLGSRLAEGERNLYVVPIPFAVLSAAPARMEYLAACRQLSCQMRPYLLFDVQGAPANVSQRQLTEIVAAVQPFARAVFATVSLRAPSLTIYGNAGFRGIGLAVPSVLDGTVPHEIVRLGEVAARQRLLPFLTNIPTAKMLEFAVSVGAQWCSGPAVAAPVPEPIAPYRCTLEALAAEAESRATALA